MEDPVEKPPDRTFLELNCSHEAVFILAACNLARSQDLEAGTISKERLTEFAEVVDMCQQLHGDIFFNQLAEKCSSIVGDRLPDAFEQLSKLIGKEAQIQLFTSFDEFKKHLQGEEDDD
jgi:hypothetical protein